MIEIDCTHKELTVHELNYFVKYTVVCEESLKQFVLDLLKGFSFFAACPGIRNCRVGRAAKTLPAS